MEKLEPSPACQALTFPLQKAKCSNMGSLADVSHEGIIIATRMTNKY